jgi:hypothetical protein
MPVFRMLVPTLAAAAALGQDVDLRTMYHVTQVASGLVYVDGGTAEGLAEGMRFTVSHLAPGDALMNRKEVAKISVLAVASHSAACQIEEASAPIQPGDTAQLDPEDAQVIQLARSPSARRDYAQVISFSEGDPLEDELRDYVPKPPLPEINRIRGRIGFEQSAIFDHTAGGTQTFQEGIAVRADMTRIGGTYWNFTGYWRGRLTTQSGSTAPQTLNDLINRTYQIGLYYNNPQSNWVAGFGRFLLPWAASLDTIDGGYIGRRVAKKVTVGMFGGSTPDPTAWNYDPSRQMFGAFLNYERGSYETVRWSTTVGAALSRLHWHPEREFLFFENTLQVNNKFSIYHDMELDRLAPALVTSGNNGVRLARSFLTLRYQATNWLTLDMNHNYFRGVPTFDPRLIGTGLLDKLLFQGFSGGVQINLPYSAILYANLGANRRDQDTKTALNYMLGLTLTKTFRLPIRTDLRYSRFNSSFGSGDYESLSVSRQLGDRLRLEVLGGQQNLRSTFTSVSRARFVTADMDYLIGRHYILGASWTVYRGGSQNYDQMFINLGYRF